MRIKGQEKVEPIEVKRCFVASDMDKSLANKLKIDVEKNVYDIIKEMKPEKKFEKLQRICQLYIARV